MSISWEHLADCLRQELAAYGGLLHLFEQQQHCLLNRDAQEVMSLGAAIEAEAQQVALSRAQREQAVADFAAQLRQPRTSTLRALLPLVAAEARPLLQALIDEVNMLLHRVRRVSRHNHTLLTRAVEVQQEVLQQLRPTAFLKTYSPAGTVSVTGSPATRLCTAS